jgi:transposase
MEDNYKTQLEDEKLAAPSRKILTSLKAHWNGLIVFVEHPHIKMDNNKGEQSIRPATLGRKVYYGSGSVWSSILTAFLFSIFATLSLWKINSRTWLTEYLRACENNYGRVPDDLSPFLPWEMSVEQKHKLSKPPT